MFEMLIGLPAAGKTTYAKELEQNGWLRVSSDDIRTDLYGDGGFNKEQQAQVFKIAHEKILEGLEYGRNVVFDATNIIRKYRMSFMQKLNPEIHKRAKLFICPINSLKERNANRDVVTPEDVYERMIRLFDPPIYFEGFDEINVVSSVGCEYDLTPYDNWDTLNAFGQNHPNHTETIGAHLHDTEMIIRSVHKNNEKLAIAARYHDIGKPMVKTEGNISHYYNHENVGSYIWLLLWMRDFYNEISADDALEIATYINMHMRPFVWKNSIKSLIRDLSMIGDEMFHNLLELNLADQIASKKENGYGKWAKVTSSCGEDN